MFDGIIDKVVTMLADKYAGKLVLKGVTALATYLIAHKFLQPSQSDNWIAANADWLTGLVLSGVSFALTQLQHNSHQDALAASVDSPVTPSTAPSITKVNIVMPIILIMGLAMAGGVQAQTVTNNTPVSGIVSNAESTFLNDAVDWFVQSSKAGAGLGGSISSLKLGRVSPVVIYENSLGSIGNTNTFYAQPCLAYTTCVDTMSHQGIGCSLDFYMVKLPSWISPSKTIPGVKNLNNLELGAFATADMDRAAKLEFGAKYTVVGLKLSINY